MEGAVHSEQHQTMATCMEPKKIATQDDPPIASPPTESIVANNNSEQLLALQDSQRQYDCSDDSTNGGSSIYSWSPQDTALDLEFMEAPYLWNTTGQQAPATQTHDDTDSKEKGVGEPSSSNSQSTAPTAESYGEATPDCEQASISARTVSPQENLNEARKKQVEADGAPSSHLAEEHSHPSHARSHQRHNLLKEAVIEENSDPTKVRISQKNVKGSTFSEQPLKCMESSTDQGAQMPYVDRLPQVDTSALEQEDPPIPATNPMPYVDRLPQVDTGAVEQEAPPIPTTNPMKENSTEEQFDMKVRLVPGSNEQPVPEKPSESKGDRGMSRSRLGRLPQVEGNVAMEKQGLAISTSKDDTLFADWDTGTETRRKETSTTSSRSINQGKCCLVTIVVVLSIIVVGSVTLMLSPAPPLPLGQEISGRVDIVPTPSISAPTMPSVPVTNPSPFPLPAVSPSTFPAVFPVTVVSTEMAPLPEPILVPVTPPTVPLQEPTLVPPSLDSIVPPTELLQIKSLVSVDPAEFDDPDSPYYRAYRFLLTEPSVSISPQRFAVALLDQAVGGSFSTAQRDECDWYGISCDVNGTVTSIHWANFLLPGYLPDDLNLLSGLEVLDLGENSLIGSIPESLYSLSLLKDLFLHTNQLSGTISESIGNLRVLERLYLGGNKLNGTIPQNIGSPGVSSASVRPLDTISLYDNMLSGSIPTGLNLRMLQYLDLGVNQLSGSVPLDWFEGRGPMVRMRVLYLDDNRLSGSLPSVGQLGNGRLQALSIQDNTFTGEFTGFPLFPNMLNVLEMHNNNFASINKKTVCNQIVFDYGELVMLRADCDVCPCKYFCGEGECYNPNSSAKQKKNANF